MEQTPFTFGKTVTGGQFVNRKTELNRLQQNFDQQVSTIVISPRRWGKTSLIHQATADWQAQRYNNAVVLMDLFDIRTEQEFYEKLLQAVVSATYNTVEQWFRYARQVLTHLRPKVELDPHSDPGFNITLDTIERGEASREVLNLAEQIAKEKGLNLVIAIDEFQNLEHFEDPVGFQKSLRSAWQHHQSVSYCLYGSKQHMMDQFFSDSSMPFYKFGDLMMLETIATRHWIPYLTDAFNKKKQRLGHKHAAELANWVDGHPYYVQQLGYILWGMQLTEYTDEDIDEACNRLIEQNSLLFEREVDQLTNPQLRTLQLLAHDEEQISSKEVLDRYRLNSSAAVYAAIKQLVAKDLVYKMDGKPALIDPLMKRWMQRRF